MTKTNVKVKLTGSDGNAFAILAKVAKALKAAGHREIVGEMQAECTQAQSYDEFLQIVMKYVIVS